MTVEVGMDGPDLQIRYTDDGDGALLGYLNVPLSEGRELERAIRMTLNRHEGTGNARWQGALKAAHENYAEEGETEFDDDVVVSDGGEEAGAYVSSWTWVKFEVCDSCYSPACKDYACSPEVAE